MREEWRSAGRQHADTNLRHGPAHPGRHSGFENSGALAARHARNLQLRSSTSRAHAIRAEFSQRTSPPSLQLRKPAEALSAAGILRPKSSRRTHSAGLLALLSGVLHAPAQAGPSAAQRALL